ncbi:MAG TPA: SDR family NAD(P)-dependent oxidoreductase [Verrucomicrobiae bacterium]|nr:SDR family NAD(P)-dependent oxidoreductase [Verrucomicrobiae bacterium]
MRFDGKTALVTGAASGIGRATALALARAGAELAVCDLNEAGLEETAAAIRSLGRSALARRVDVARADDVRAFADAVHAEHEAVDVLVNNAGVGLGGGFLDTSLEDWQWILSINLWGVIHGCHFFLPPMVRRGRGGHVVNVSSAAGFLATPQLAAYSATKFAVFGLSEALREELRPHGIAVTTVCPGIINTPITTSSPMRGPLAAPEVRATLVELYRRRNYGPERVAANVLKAIARRRAVAPISPEAWVMYLMKRLSPGLTARLNRALQARMERQMGLSPAPPRARA